MLLSLPSILNHRSYLPILSLQGMTLDHLDCKPPYPLKPQPLTPSNATSF